MPATAAALFSATAAVKDRLTDLLSNPLEVSAYGPLGPAAARDAFRAAQGAEAARTVAPFVSAARPASLHPAVADRVAWATSVTAPAASHAAALRREVEDHLAALLGRDGALFLPAAPTPAPPADGSGSSDATRNALLELTCVAGLARLPQVVLPIARDADDGLPVGLGVIGPRGSDEALLALAREMGGVYGCG